MLIAFEVAFVVLDRSNCSLLGLRVGVGVMAIITLLVHLSLLFGQVRSV